jgi:hypothetical protein
MDASQIKIKKVLLTPSGSVVETPKVSKLPDDLPKKPLKDMRLFKVTLTPRSRTTRAELPPNGHWQFDKQLCQDNQFGFIYLIHDTVNSRMYIGKKQYKGAGQANRGEESNWKTYSSSCKALQEAIKANEKHGFLFYVLDEYRIKGTLGYAETWSLMYVEAPCNRDKWYNMLVNKVSWSVKEGVSDKHKMRLKSILAGEVDDLTVWS